MLLVKKAYTFIEILVRPAVTLAASDHMISRAHELDASTNCLSDQISRLI